MSKKAHVKRSNALATASAVLAEDWDSSDWTTYIVNGRVLPERSGVWVNGQNAKGTSGKNRFTSDLKIVDGFISCICKVDEPISPFQLSDIVRNLAFFPTDYIAFLHRSYYDIILDTCRNEATGEVISFSVHEPFFEPTLDGFLFKPGEVNQDIPWFTTNECLITALHDLSQSLRYPRRTNEYCRMAVETIRRHFDPQDEKSWKVRWTKGEILMCTQLRLSRASLRKLESIAAPNRHGEQPYDLSWEQRRETLQFAWEIAYRFRLYLEGNDPAEWTSI